MKKFLFSVLIISLLFSGCSAGQSTEPTDTAADSEAHDAQKGSLIDESETSDAEASDAETSYIESSADMILEAHTISDFEIIGQLPELPTGCEITALTMALNYYGLSPDKLELAEIYLPKTEYSVHYNGFKYIGPDLDNYFVGEPSSEYGYVCGTGAIVTAANAFLSDAGSLLTAKDLSGCDPIELYEYVSENTPVVVWTTIEMADRGETEGWYTESGKYVEWSSNDHCSVLIGFSDSTVTIADPLLGIVEYDRAQFESVLASRGNKAVVLVEQ